MSASSSIHSAVNRIGSTGRLARDPRVVVRVILGVLLVANLVTALVLFRPWGSTAQELNRVREQVIARQATVDQLRSVVDKVEQAREDGDRFIRQYFLADRTASSTIIEALGDAAAAAGINQQTQNFQPEPIDGSTDLSMITITVNCQGSYPNLVEFINLMDRSSRFLILDTLTAAPQRSAGLLNVGLRIHAFVNHRGDGGDNGYGDQASSEIADARVNP